MKLYTSMNFKIWLNETKQEWSRDEFIHYISTMPPYNTMEDLPKILAKYSYFIFEPALPISKTNIRDYYSPNINMIKSYQKLPSKTMPPIIVGMNSFGDYDILDGSHRVHSLIANKYKTVLAFVGITEAQHSQQS